MLGYSASNVSWHHTFWVSYAKSWSRACDVHSPSVTERKVKIVT